MARRCGARAWCVGRARPVAAAPAGSSSTLPQVALHLRPVARDEEVAARREEPLGVVPRRAHERDAARERLERPDGRDAGQRGRVGPARHVHRDAEARRTRAGTAWFGQPAAVLDAGLGERAPRRLRVAHAVDARAQAERPHRLEQELLELGRALVVAPVADPDEVALARDAGLRPEDARVGRLVPGPRAPGPAAGEVEVAEDRAEGEHAVVGREIVPRDRLGVGDRAVVRVVEEQAVAAVGRPMTPSSATRSGSFHSWTSTTSAPSSARPRSSVALVVPEGPQGGERRANRVERPLAVVAARGSATLQASRGS